MSALEQLGQRQTFFGNFRMERESYPLCYDVELLPQLINTHGTEVAPGSPKVREYFQDFSRHV